jgi:hypothetical protein
MQQAASNFPPRRVTDLIALRQSGSQVNCRVAFEILPVDFTHRDNPYQAYIFLCRYSGDVDNTPYQFRKCYARGCPHNLCPHVSQAILIANRFLQRDYRRLEAGGLTITKELFTLPEMLLKFDDSRKEYGAVMAIQDYINLAAEGNRTSATVQLEYVPAVEHFAGRKNAQTFLMIHLTMACLGSTGTIERCLACYSRENEATEKPEAISVANARLQGLYNDFKTAGISHDTKWFD